MSILSIGTVVRLKNGERKLMIMSRTPLANENGIIGYFDYGGCLFPEGQVNQQSYFFNNEDIDEIFHEGYVDEIEEAYRKRYEKEIKNISYPKLSIKAIIKNDKNDNNDKM